MSAQGRTNGEGSSSTIQTGQRVMGDRSTRDMQAGSMEVVREVPMKSAKPKGVSTIGLFGPPPKTDPLKLSKRTSTVKTWIEAKPGAQGLPFTPRKNSPPLVLIYKVMGKMFAILSLRGVEDVILKCDPLLASALRNDYSGIGHRSHLDRRFWISVRLDADVPAKEIRRLVSLSYDLVCANLTAKQRAELARLTRGKNVLETD